MRLARLAQRLRTYDWTAAAIELLIVIVGILIALQVSNWNQDRLDRVRGEDTALVHLAALQSDLTNTASTRAFWNQVADYQAAALAHGERGELVDGSAWKTVLAYYQAGQIRPFELENTSFSEMRDAGDLGLIADEDLRKDLSNYYRMSGGGISAQILQHDPAYRMQIRGLVPIKVQEHIWTHCFRQLKGTDQRLLACESPIPEAEAEAILQTLRGSESLLQNLRTWVAWLRVSGFVITEAERMARLMEGRLAAKG